MKQKVVSIGDINVANDLPFVLFGGMNVLESRDLAMRNISCVGKITGSSGKSRRFATHNKTAPNDTALPCRFFNTWSSHNASERR